MGIVILIPLFVLLYFLFIRPQQRKMRAHRELMQTLDVGHEVLTTSGIYGVVQELDGDTVFLEVADGVQLKVTKESVGAIIEYDDESVDG